MNQDTEKILKQMGFIPFDDVPDRDDGTVHWFIPETSRRPRFSIKFFPNTPPSGLMHAIWRAGAEEKKQEILKAREAYLATLNDLP